MPADRFFHPRAGHSDKVTKLTDLEYRVWTQYLLSADDFGVMRASAVAIQNDNDALDAKKPKVIQAALERIVLVGLLHVFAHQGRRYVFQHDWQTWQKVEWPRATVHPPPVGDDLAKCDPATRELFGKHPGGNSRKKPKQPPIHLGRASQMIPESLPSLACARSSPTPAWRPDVPRVAASTALPGDTFRVWEPCP